MESEVDDQSITQLIQIFEDIPDSYLNQIENMCDENQNFSSDQFSRLIQNEFEYLPFSKTLVDWFALNPNSNPYEIQIIIKTARLCKAGVKTSEMQLVWSGPLPEGIPIRDTEQVIIDLIDNAEKSLFISSFAVYKAKHVLKKLSDAIERGIEVSLLLETPESSHFKIKIDPLKTLPKMILDHANILIWPFQKRIRNGENNGGSLHAKFIIQDESRLFISSANLTESAFERNIELGVLISNQAVVRKLKQHIKNLFYENLIINLI